MVMDEIFMMYNLHIGGRQIVDGMILLANEVVGNPKGRVWY